MPIVRQGPFFVSQDLAVVPSLGLASSNLDACVRKAKSHPYLSVFGSPAFGFLEDSLDALDQLPQLEHIWFWDVSLNNIDALYGLSKLTSFGVHPKRPAIDFSRLRSLRQMVLTYKPSDVGIGSLPLRSLDVWHFAPKEKSFARLELPGTLEALKILWANPAALAGLPCIPGLRRLEIHRCRNLASLATLPDLFPALEHLVVDACGRVDPEEGRRVVAGMPSLTHAWVQGKKFV